EQVLRMTLSEAVEYYDATAPKGEFGLVIEGAPDSKEPEVSPDEALERVRALREHGLSLKEACRRVSEETGIGKNTLYDSAVKG
ncbi:MAG: 16S rRNA (cytidine(1402)-2'-O)-methyltransferase, partial [Oscillospiraceae bacterium]|nr:16S rRNA (cytidine(1402)-2'-O)-methyltransferase [Oscillospiraceae bacterium]